AAAFDLTGCRVVTLIDTLGFDGASPNNTDIFNTIAALPADLYERGCKLAGTIYFYRIPDCKMSELLTSRKDSGAFRKLCGDSARCQHANGPRGWQRARGQVEESLRGHFRKRCSDRTSREHRSSAERLIRLIPCNLP
ncbi:hypothetical protein BJ322DRAFT_1001303, partial [Thelephora terrestris]